MKTINFYQKHISPRLKEIIIFSESGCRFHPTCSDYTLQAIKKYGILKGTFLGTKRILRCNSLFKGGIEYP